MMGIYIRGMEMPEMCDMCPFLVFIEKGEDHDAFCYCKLRNWKKSCTPEPITVFQARRFRHLDCPLIPVPPHGRLVDADALLGDLPVEYPSIVYAIETAPTIIEEAADAWNRRVE